MFFNFLEKYSKAGRAELQDHGLINYIDIKAKCRHLKKVTCKGTLRQVFIKIYRLGIQSVMLIQYFDPAL